MSLFAVTRCLAGLPLCWWLSRTYYATMVGGAVVRMLTLRGSVSNTDVMSYLLYSVLIIAYGISYRCFIHIELMWLVGTCLAKCVCCSFLTSLVFLSGRSALCWVWGLDCYRGGEGGGYFYGRWALGWCQRSCWEIQYGCHSSGCWLHIQHECKTIQSCSGAILLCGIVISAWCCQWCQRNVPVR